MKKSSQNQPVGVSVPAIPERVGVAMSEIAENMHEGLLALAVGAGPAGDAGVIEADISTLAGPKGKHDMVRMAVRHGRERASVTLGGRRVPITRPRVGPPTGPGRSRSPRMSCSGSTELLGKLALERMLAGLSTRRYPVGLEPVGGQVDEESSATSGSAVSRGLWR